MRSVPPGHGDDLFLVFRTDGSWGPAVHLGPGVNDAHTGSVKPRLGPDHHTLYFMSDRATSTPPPRPPESTAPAFHI